MFEYFLDDPEFVKRVDEKLDKLKSVANANDKDVLELSKQQMEQSQKDFENLITKQIEDIKKAKLSEKYPLLSKGNKMYNGAEKYKPITHEVLTAA